MKTFLSLITLTLLVGLVGSCAAGAPVWHQLIICLGMLTTAYHLAVSAQRPAVATDEDE